MRIICAEDDTSLNTKPERCGLYAWLSNHKCFCTTFLMLCFLAVGLHIYFVNMEAMQPMKLGINFDLKNANHLEGDLEEIEIVIRNDHYDLAELHNLVIQVQYEDDGIFLTYQLDEWRIDAGVISQRNATFSYTKGVKTARTKSWTADIQYTLCHPTFVHGDVCHVLNLMRNDTFTGLCQINPKDCENVPGYSDLKSLIAQ